MKRPRLMREPQRCGEFSAGDPHSGYYNDLRPELRASTPADALDRLASLLAADRISPVTIAQLGLAAWQKLPEHSSWAQVVTTTAYALADRMDAEGGLPATWPMAHTYRIDPPWLSALSQGEAASLFVRSAPLSDDLDFEEAARRAVRPLLEPSPIVVETADGTVLQEYPTTPPSHVLNGWIYALWGLYDVSHAGSPPSTDVAYRAFENGARTLARRLPLYDVLGGWSRYDLYPHRLVHVASPYYHRLHIELLLAMERLAPGLGFAEHATRWRRALSSRPTLATAVARKVAFRLLEPRRKA
jgi:heparosan-N-sulfate-glucuronate 5-epimerase